MPVPRTLVNDPVVRTIDTFTPTVGGTVPPPGIVQDYFLRDDGTWQPAVTSVSPFTTSTAGTVSDPSATTQPDTIVAPNGHLLQRNNTWVKPNQRLASVSSLSGETDSQ